MNNLRKPPKLPAHVWVVAVNDGYVDPFFNDRNCLRAYPTFEIARQMWGFTYPIIKVRLSQVVTPARKKK